MRRGAAGVIVFHSDTTGDLLQMGGLEDTDIPAYFISAEDGASLASSIGSVPAEQPLAVTLDATRVDSADRLGTKWRRSVREGPTPGLNLKPDIAAPCAAVFAIGGRTPGMTRGRLQASAGERASLRCGCQRRPRRLSGSCIRTGPRGEVASALINTASTAVRENNETARVGLGWLGAPLLSFESAFEPIATVAPANHRLRTLHGRGPSPVSHDVAITNRTSETQQYRVEVVRRDADATAGR